MVFKLSGTSEGLLYLIISFSNLNYYWKLLYIKTKQCGSDGN